MMDLFAEIARYFSDAGTGRRIVMLGAMLLGISSGVMGTFAVLRKQSLIGDAMSHAALPGVCLVFLFFGTKNPLVLLVGASATGLLGALCVLGIRRHSRLKNDAAIGLVLSVFFGIGTILLTYIQNLGIGGQAGLDRFLFGNATSLMRRDIYTMASISLVLIVLVIVFYKQFKLLCFDPEFGTSLGVPMRFFDYFLTTLIVLTIMVGLQAVGVVLMVAMLILPAGAARQWTNRLGRMLVIAAVIGACSGILGAFCSSLAAKTPTGPVIVLVSGVVLIFSMLMAPQRGLLFRWLRLWKNRRKIQRENFLKNFYKISGENELEPAVVLAADLANLPCHHRCLGRLLRKRLAKKNAGIFSLTPAGNEQARQILRKHRLWELYLSRQMDIAADHVHRDAEEIEHVLSPAIVRELEKLLDNPANDPHGKPIPHK